MTIFVTKGDAPLTPAQLQRREDKVLARDWPMRRRLRLMRRGDGPYGIAMDAVEADEARNKINNTFNRKLRRYRRAVARLARYELSVGRIEVWEDQPTGALDGLGDPTMESVLIQTAIVSLPALVDGFDYTNPEVPNPAQVPNPAIVKDEAERAEAQKTINTTPQAVKNFD